MSDINWKDGAVCSVSGEQWQTSMDDGLQGDVFHACCSDLSILLDGVNFQLNEIREGDFIQASELDTEQKYNEVIGVFGLFGVDGGFSKDSGEYNSFKKLLEGHSQSRAVIHEVEGKLCTGVIFKDFDHFSKRQLTYSQIIAIGKLKRMMLERERSTGGYFYVSRVYNAEDFPKLDLEEKPKRRNKSKQAYDILKSLDYEYDLVKQRWYKKQYID